MKIDKSKIIPSLTTSLPLVGLYEYVAATAFEYLPKIQDNFSSAKTIVDNWLLDPGNVITSSFSNEYFLYSQPLFAAALLYFMKKDVIDANHEFEDASNYGAFGTSHFMKVNELKSAKVKQHLATNFKQPGTLLGMYDGKPLIHHDKSFKNRNVAVFGISGTQKSTAYFIPNILNTQDESIVVTDPKAELYRLTSEAKRKQGYKVHLISFILGETENSDSYNPLDYIKNDTEVADLAWTLTVNAIGKPSGDGQYWAQAQANLLAALILYTKYFLPKEQQHLGSVYELLTMKPADLEKLVNKLPNEHIVARSFNGAIKGIEERQKSQFFSGAKVALNPWVYDEIRKLTYKTDFDFKDIGKEKTIVYVRVPIAKSYARPLIATFFTQMFEELYAVGGANNGSLPVPVRLLLDEFNNIGTIPHFEERLSTTRSYKIYVSMGIQSLEQLRDRYGRGKAAEIMDNCDTTIFLGSNDEDAKEYFSKKIGVTTVKIQNESHNKSDRGSSAGESFSYATRPLLYPYELGQLPDDTTIVFMRGVPPLRLKKAYYKSIKSLYMQVAGEEASLNNYVSSDRSDYTVHDPHSIVKAMKKDEDAAEEKRQELQKNLIKDAIDSALAAHGIGVENEPSKAVSTATIEADKPRKEVLLDDEDEDFEI